MRNWAVDENKIKQKGEKAYAIWKLEQMINFGLDSREKIKISELKKYWPDLQLDPNRRKTLEFLLK
ncbi:MAG: hypothetical protein A3E98_00410 [Candidatus Doudnabacteria bacterium RIFCSPHIGHO2_12_FULL_48_11]|nr:MAG: hypothetical protein A3E98_00410 [Candidatus Doudnabacteria bacterium RIFCSPHIGHO2_12_FULL_48_11]